MASNFVFKINGIANNSRIIEFSIHPILLEKPASLLALDWKLKSCYEQLLDSLMKRHVELDVKRNQFKLVLIGNLKKKCCYNLYYYFPIMMKNIPDSKGILNLMETWKDLYNLLRLNKEKSLMTIYRRNNFFHHRMATENFQQHFYECPHDSSRRKSFVCSAIYHQGI